jgi:thiol:disulfide interchange protein DsbC
MRTIFKKEKAHVKWRYPWAAYAVSLLLATLALPAGTASGFQKEGCGTGECRDCHALKKEEAAKILGNTVDRVIDVDFSEVQGLWTVDVEKQGHKFPIYLHFSKKYVISGNVLRLETMENVTEELAINLNRIDTAQIPLDEALVMGKPEARQRLIVFTDPECPFCKKLHPELKRLVEKRSDIVVFVKMFPLAIHPKAYEKAKAIVCAKSEKLLEESFAGKDLPPAGCETKRLDENLELAKKIGINSAPTIIFPDGRVFPGYRSAEDIIRIMEGPPKAPAAPEAPAAPRSPAPTSVPGGGQKP